MGLRRIRRVPSHVGRITVTDCVFDVPAGCEPVLELPKEVLEGVDVLIRGEMFRRPAALSPALLGSLAHRTGVVRLGPCPECGFLCMYGTGRVLEPHAVDECIVAQIMGS